MSRPSGRNAYLLIACAIASAGCSADPGPDLKTDDDGAVRADTAVTNDSTAPEDTGAVRDTALSPDSRNPGDSSAIDSTVGDSAFDSTVAEVGLEVGVDSTIDVGVDTAVDAPGSDASCPTCPITLKYKTPSTAATSTDMKPYVDLTNGGATDQPLSEITVRYWFTIDGDHALINFCDYAKIGCGNLTGSYTKLATPKATADYYFELAFTAGAGNLAAGASTGEIQLRLHKSDFTSWSQTNDWSFDGTKTAYAAWDHITVYRKGVLVYGTEPP